MITEYGIEAKSNSEIISELGGRFKQYRLFSNLTQKEEGMLKYILILDTFTYLIRKQNS